MFYFSDKFQALRDQLNEFGSFVVGVGHRRHRACQSYRNAFDIPRSSLLDQILRMRSNFLTTTPSHMKLHDEGELICKTKRGSLPISLAKHTADHTIISVFHEFLKQVLLVLVPALRPFVGFSSSDLYI